MSDRQKYIPFKNTAITNLQTPISSNGHVTHSYCKITLKPGFTFQCKILRNIYHRYQRLLRISKPAQFQIRPSNASTNVQCNPLSIGFDPLLHHLLCTKLPIKTVPPKDKAQAYAEDEKHYLTLHAGSVNPKYVNRVGKLSLK